MNDLCPFDFITRTPDYTSTSPKSMSLVKVLTEKSEHNGYLAHFQCMCQTCGKMFEVRMEANPYYESYIWPEIAACKR